MFTAITHSQVFVLDQDQALDFYVGKLGLEIGQDVDLGFMRWLTVRVPGDAAREIILEVPGVPQHDPETAEEVKALVAKGALGAAAILSTDDCQATYEDLLAKGVEVTQPPVERFYGTDCGIRDPFGNHIRFTQPVQGDMVVPSQDELNQQFA